jgi:hypothetical protein
MPRFPRARSPRSRRGRPVHGRGRDRHVARAEGAARRSARSSSRRRSAPWPVRCNQDKRRFMPPRSRRCESPWWHRSEGRGGGAFAASSASLPSCCRSKAAFAMHAQSLIAWVRPGSVAPTPTMKREQPPATQKETASLAPSRPEIFVPSTSDPAGPIPRHQPPRAASARDMRSIAAGIPCHEGRHRS